jgi:hypothetical protein
MKPNYNYIFHFSEYREENQAWAYFSVDNQIRYWNGMQISKGKIDTAKSKIVYAATPEECVKLAIEKAYHE